MNPGSESAKSLRKSLSTRLVLHLIDRVEWVDFKIPQKLSTGSGIQAIIT